MYHTILPYCNAVPYSVNNVAKFARLPLMSPSLTHSAIAIALPRLLCLLMLPSAAAVSLVAVC
jgi:hypothetical protein